MTTLRNSITINAPVEVIWDILSNVEQLEKYDPTVKHSKAITREMSGKGARRKVTMKDGKNWFEETCTASVQYEALAFELNACSFPIDGLKHSYTFEIQGSETRVSQQMDYKMKFGLLGKLMDALMVRRQTQNGIDLFLTGLKQYAERVKGQG